MGKDVFSLRSGFQPYRARFKVPKRHAMGNEITDSHGAAIDISQCLLTMPETAPVCTHKGLLHIVELVEISPYSGLVGSETGEDVPAFPVV